MKPPLVDESAGGTDRKAGLELWTQAGHITGKSEGYDSTDHDLALGRFLHHF